MANRGSVCPVLFSILIALICSCQKEQPPIKIGFVANLTKEPATMAISARNGALLAVEDINAHGGIHDRKIVLVIKDDHLDPEIAIKADQELIRDHVAAIVGHIHSDMSLAALPLINQAQMVMLSPVSASSKLSGLDDYFFRINSPSTETSIATAACAYRKGLRHVTVLYDVSIKSYSEPKFLDFKNAFEGMGGQVTAETFTSGRGVSFPQIVTNWVKSGQDGYFIIAGSRDTAMICQHLRKIAVTDPIFISPWAYDPELIHNGGTAVEGVIFAHSFQRDSREPAFFEFKENFFKRYRSTPEIWETFSYEAIMVLFQALSQNPDPKQLKTTLLKIRRFKGLQGDILFDQYGDNRRKPLLLTIKEGAFVETQ